jgi:hypothetical protein
MSNQIETLINVQLENRNKTTVFWRGILVVPVAIFFSAIAGTFDSSSTLPLLMAPTVMALLFRGIYPSYFLTFNHAVMELSTRISSYLYLLNDDYPSIERNPNVAVIFPDVDGGKKLNRGLPLVKWILALPLYVVGVCYIIAAMAVTFIAWIQTWSSGKYPEWALPIVLGTLRYWNRVSGYAFTLVTDEYPAFSLN